MYFFNENLTFRKKLLYLGLVICFIGLNTAYFFGKDVELAKWLIVFAVFGLSSTTVALMAILTKNEIRDCSMAYFLANLAVLPALWLGFLYITGIIFEFESDFLSEDITIYNINRVALVDIPLISLVGFMMKRKIDQ